MPAQNTHGGAREGAGRPVTNGRCIKLSVRISPEAACQLDRIANKSAYIDRLILQASRIDRQVGQMEE